MQVTTRSWPNILQFHATPTQTVSAVGNDRTEIRLHVILLDNLIRYRMPVVRLSKRLQSCNASRTVLYSHIQYENEVGR